MLLIGVLNHLLGQAPAVQADLAKQAGRTFAVYLPLFDANVVIMPDGLLAHSAAEPEAILRLPTRFFLTRLNDAQAASRLVVLEGDAELASKAGAALGALSWDVAEDLSLLIGDVLANRVVMTSQALATMPLSFGQRFAETVAEYLRDEDRLLPRKEAVAEFCDAVDTLRHDLARLEKRFTRLESSVATEFAKGS